MKLYGVTTVVNEFHGRKNVSLDWFRSQPTRGQRPYAELIEGYKPGDRYIAYAEGLIDELFTEDEVAQLKTYLDQTNGHEGRTEVKEVELPVPSNTMGVSAIPVGDPQDFLMIHRRPDYPLPFKAIGYYDLRQHELIDGHQAPAPLSDDEIKF